MDFQIHHATNVARNAKIFTGWNTPTQSTTCPENEGDASILERHGNLRSGSRHRLGSRRATHSQILANMKIYRLHVRQHQAGSVGYQFFTSKAAAEIAEREAKCHEDHEATAIDGPREIKLTKAGVLAALNLYAAHPDNG
jgi:hypothetical protein